MQLLPEKCSSMASLNPYAPLFMPAVGSPLASAPFLSPFTCAYGYPYTHAPPQHMCGLSCGLLPEDSDSPTHQLHLCFSCYYYFYHHPHPHPHPHCYQHGIEIDPGVPLPWSSYTLVRMAAPFVSPTQQVTLPFFPHFPIMQDRPLAPPPAEILEVPPTPLMRSQMSSGKPLQRALALQKRRVKVGHRVRVMAGNKNGTGGVVGGMVRRGPGKSGRGGIKSLWAPRLRRHRKKSPAEMKLYETFEFKDTGLLRGGGSKLADVGVNDARTTVMIKNVPNKLTKGTLLELLDHHCRMENRKAAACGQLQQGGGPFIPSRFNFFYLPIDFRTGSNLGYAFVNLTSAAAAWRLHRAFHRKPWTDFGSKKICEITYARIQGLQALLKHFRNTTFLCDRNELLPVHFVPYRDGIFQERRRYVGRRISTLHSWRPC